MLLLSGVTRTILSGLFEPTSGNRANLKTRLSSYQIMFLRHLLSQDVARITALKCRLVISLNRPSRLVFSNLFHSGRCWHKRHNILVGSESQHC